ncbi:Rho guanine nucleotide exchange factor 19, partial [Chelydra serpentina]
APGLHQPSPWCSDIMGGSRHGQAVGPLMCPGLVILVSPGWSLARPPGSDVSFSSLGRGPRQIFPLISQSRWLVKHGELVEVDMQLVSTLAAKFKLSTKMVYLHLFNDCLLLSRRKETGKFAVFVHAKMPELKVTDLSRKLHGVPGQIFHLQLFASQRLKHQVLLRAQSESEKQRWISAMAPSSPRTDREHVTENADTAQVQCIKAYKAQEPDELTLEKADILGVRTRTSDGWLEGIRLSDGERGWVPRGHVEEITSRGARLRNLRENDRLKLATRKLEEGQA